MLEYNPSTGLFRHVKPHGPSARTYWHSGSFDGKGRALTVFFDGGNHLAHRVAWKLTYGDWPHATIDHINGDPKDNRLCNLRCVSQQTNNRNIRKARSHNVVGVLGVTKFRKGYRARITVDGVSIHLGLFGSVDAASIAYATAKALYHGDVHV